MVFSHNLRGATLSRAVACLLALAAWPSQGFAQAAATEADRLITLYNAGTQAFAAGKWAEAAKAFEELIGGVSDDKAGQLQAVYYTLGASYFNQPDFPKAIDTFKRYLAKFPKGEKAAEIQWQLAQAHLANKEYEAAAPIFATFENNPAYRDRAIAAGVRCLKELKQPEKAIRLLEKLIAPEIKTTAQANGAIELAGFYAETNEPEKAVGVLQQLQRKTAIIGNLVALNGVAVKLGDEFAEKNLYKEAIAAYRAVRPRDQVIKLQTERLRLMHQRVAYNLRAATGNPQAMAQAQMENLQIKSLQAEQKELLAAFEKLPDFAAALLFR